MGATATQLLTTAMQLLTTATQLLNSMRSNAMKMLNFTGI